MFKRIHSCYTNTDRCSKGIRLLNQYASLRGIKAQHALHEVLLQSLPGMIAKLGGAVKGPSRKNVR